MGTIVAAVVGGVLAVGAGFGLISSQTSVPPVVNKEYIVYGNS